MKVLVCEQHAYGGSIRVGSHQIARALLARGHEVIWSSHPRSWAHRLIEVPPAQSVRHPDGVLELRLRAALPYVGLPLLDTSWWGRHWLRSAPGNAARLKTAGADRCDLLWISDFTQLPILDLVEARRRVFRFFDHLEHFRWTPRSIFDLAHRYRHFADLILASSQHLRQALEKRGLAAEYLPNGADTDRFPEELALRDDREPLVVYIGAIEEWFDLQAVELWAGALPQMQFLIAGPNRRGLSSSRPNIDFAGPVDYDSVPALLARARIGIIPFLRTPLTLGVHPLKLYEYLAAGCPVLSVDLPEVEERPEGVRVYRSPQEGLERLAALLTKPVDRGALRRIAIQNRWEFRLDKVAEFLNDGSSVQLHPL